MGGSISWSLLFSLDLEVEEEKVEQERMDPWNLGPAVTRICPRVPSSRIICPITNLFHEINSLKEEVGGPGQISHLPSTRPRFFLFFLDLEVERGRRGREEAGG